MAENDTPQWVKDRGLEDSYDSEQSQVGVKKPTDTSWGQKMEREIIEKRLAGSEIAKRRGGTGSLTQEAIDADPYGDISQPISQRSEAGQAAQTGEQPAVSSEPQKPKSVLERLNESNK